MARKPTGRRPGRPRDKIQYLSDIQRVVEMRILVLREEVADYKEAARLLAPDADPPGLTVSVRSKERRLQRQYERFMPLPWFVARVKTALARPRRRRSAWDSFLEARRLTMEMMQVRDSYIQYVRTTKELERVMRLMTSGALLTDM